MYLQWSALLVHTIWSYMITWEIFHELYVSLYLKLSHVFHNLVLQWPCDLLMLRLATLNLARITLVELWYKKLFLPVWMKGYVSIVCSDTNKFPLSTIVMYDLAFFHCSQRSTYKNLLEWFSMVIIGLAERSVIGGNYGIVQEIGAIFSAM